MPLLSVRDLTVVFPRQSSAAAAVDTVSFDLAEGECMAIVGESGSGKSMICQAVIRLVPEPGRIVRRLSSSSTERTCSRARSDSCGESAAVRSERCFRTLRRP